MAEEVDDPFDRLGKAFPGNRLEDVGEEVEARVIEGGPEFVTASTAEVGPEFLRRIEGDGGVAAHPNIEPEPVCFALRSDDTVDERLSRGREAAVPSGAGVVGFLGDLQCGEACGVPAHLRADEVQPAAEIETGFTEAQHQVEAPATGGVLGGVRRGLHGARSRIAVVEVAADEKRVLTVQGVERGADASGLFSGAVGD